MKIVPFLKSLSRSVHNQEQHDHLQEDKANENSTSGASTSLTVWRKSLLISCKGFTVIDSNGDLAYRVDNYVGHPEEVVLMDGSGKSILTMRRKKLSLVDSWFVHEGEVGDFCTRSKTTKASKSMPMFWVRKNIKMLNANSSRLARVYREAWGHKRHAYVIEGSYAHRSCKVLDDSRNVVCEIKRKEANAGGVCYGVEVFHLIVHPGFDSGFAMALVVVLDQLFS